MQFQLVQSSIVYPNGKHQPGALWCTNCNNDPWYYHVTGTILCQSKGKVTFGMENEKFVVEERRSVNGNRDSQIENEEKNSRSVTK